MHTQGNPVEIKGQKDGLWILLGTQLPVEEILTILRQKLTASNNFFAGADVTIDTGTRQWTAEEEQQLRTLVEEQHGLQVREIRLSSEESGTQPHADMLTAPPPEADPVDAEATSQLRASFTTHQENDQGDAEATQETHAEEGDVDDEFMRVLDETFRIPVHQKLEHKQTYSSDYLYENEESSFYFRGTVRSGQTLEFPGNIVILGDVNPGAYVIASGDIIVMGRLHGVVHAGAEGEERAVVIGAHFSPSQLRIAQYIGRSPDEYPRSHTTQSQLEKAYVKGGTIVIEPVL